MRASPRLVMSAGGELREVLVLGTARVVQLRHHLGRDELICRPRKKECRHADAAHLPPRLVLIFVKPRRDDLHQAKAEQCPGNVWNARKRVLHNESGDLLPVLAPRGDLDGDGAAERPPEHEDLVGINVAPLREVVEARLRVHVNAFLGRSAVGVAIPAVLEKAHVASHGLDQTLGI